MGKLLGPRDIGARGDNDEGHGVSLSGVLSCLKVMSRFSEAQSWMQRRESAKGLQVLRYLH
ncbi:hypothetical protein L211DRAFT_839461, partial [Terfezia boudieri ATCC MYA-4762]